MEMKINDNFCAIDLDNLMTINGGKQSDYDFGHKLGSGLRWIWDNGWGNFLGSGTPCY